MAGIVPIELRPLPAKAADKRKTFETFESRGDEGEYSGFLPLSPAQAAKEVQKYAAAIRSKLAANLTFGPDGHGAFLLLSGNMGTGKSHLLDAMYHEVTSTANAPAALKNTYDESPVYVYDPRSDKNPNPEARRQLYRLHYDPAFLHKTATNPLHLLDANGNRLHSWFLVGDHISFSIADRQIFEEGVWGNQSFADSDISRTRLSEFNANLSIPNGLDGAGLEKELINIPCRRDHVKVPFFILPPGRSLQVEHHLDLSGSVRHMSQNAHANWFVSQRYADIRGRETALKSIGSPKVVLLDDLGRVPHGVDAKVYWGGFAALLDWAIREGAMLVATSNIGLDSIPHQFEDRKESGRIASRLTGISREVIIEASDYRQVLAQRRMQEQADGCRDWII